MKTLDGKVALITGGTRGLGAAIAKRYAQEGANLIILARNITQLEILDDVLASYGVDVMLVPYDLRNHENLGELAKAIADRGNVQISVSRFNCSALI